MRMGGIVVIEYALPYYVKLVLELGFQSPLPSRDLIHVHPLSLLVPPRSCTKDFSTKLLEGLPMSYCGPGVAPSVNSQAEQLIPR